MSEELSKAWRADGSGDLLRLAGDLSCTGWAMADIGEDDRGRMDLVSVLAVMAVTLAFLVVVV